MSSSTRRRSAASSQSPIVIAPLFYAQELTGLTGRVSRILVEPDPGRQAEVRASPHAPGGRPRRTSRDTDYDERLFANGGVREQPVDRACSR